MYNEQQNEYGRRFYKVGYTVPGSASQEPVSTINYPFTENNPSSSGNIITQGSSQPQVLKLPSDQKLKVLSGESYFIYCLVRLVSNQNSINVEFENINVAPNNGNSNRPWSNDTVPMTFDVYAHLHCDV